MNETPSNLLNADLKTLPLSFLSRLLNISPSQWPRVTECWLITFFFKVGSAIGWTVLTASFVSRFGIPYLPLLLVINAVLTMVSTYFFESLIMRIKREVLMIIMILMASICLFFATFLYDRSIVAFFTLVIVAESLFLAQFNIFIPILVADRFTPLESQRTLPFIESGESIGGMIGGILIGLFIMQFPVTSFLYLWIACLSCIVFVFIFTSYGKTRLPPLPFNVESEHAPRRRKDEIVQLIKSIKKVPFLKGIVLVVLLQWVFMNILEFQYTKALEQGITGRQEETIANVNPKELQAALLGSPEGIDNLTPEYARTPGRELRNLSHEEEVSLARQLGTWKGAFHTAALVIQILFASRIITSLGIVGSMLLHPIIMLMSLVGMFLKFSVPAAIVTRANFEITNVVHKNAYFASHYVFPKHIRDQAAEFLEGIVRPLGTIVGMISILALQTFFSGKELSLWIHILMFGFMGAVLLITLKLQTKYTNLSKEQLFADVPYPEKLNAVEILAQRGHDDAASILMEKLTAPSTLKHSEAVLVRIKVLTALGDLKEYHALPALLDALYDKEGEVRLEAAKALMNFPDIGKHFYSQAFSRYRMIETLKDVFRTEKSTSVRTAIIKVFSLLKNADVVPFLLEVLQSGEAKIKADCIYTLGLFKDPTTSYYIAPFLEDQDPMIRASAMIALWQFPRYKNLVESHLKKMTESEDVEVMRAALFVMGEIKAPQKMKLLASLRSDNPALKLEAAFALTKMGEPRGFMVLVDHYLLQSFEQFNVLHRFVRHLTNGLKRKMHQFLIHTIAQELNHIMKKFPNRKLDELDKPILEKLERLYTLLDQHEELFAIQRALELKLSNASGSQA